MTKVKQLTSVSKSMQHYGRSVFYQQGNIDFKGSLRRQEIPFVELPDLQHDVVFYRYNHGDKYAVIKSDESGETVYLTCSIPLDLNWDALIRDCDGQLQGELPMEMVTKAKLILDRACLDATEESDDLFDTPKAPRIEDIRMAIVKQGYSIKELSTMQHYDVDSEFWKLIING